MDSPVGPPRLSGLKYTLVAGLVLLTTDALFAQRAGQSDVDALKKQMRQMKRQYGIERQQWFDFERPSHD